jgi:hypothetical protein
MTNDDRASEDEANSTTLCVLPWVHLSTTVDGVWGRCCFDATNDYDSYYREPTEPVFALDDDAIGCLPNSRYAVDNPSRALGPAEAFNSPALRRTRLQMLAGERPPACYSCFRQEDLGVESHRGYMNRLFADRLDVAEVYGSTGPDGTVPGFPPYLDLRFGNTCNLSCIMCSFPISSRLGAGRTPPWATAHIDPYADDDGFWGALRANCHQVRWLYIAGGEPFLQRGHLKLLDLLIEEGAAPVIEIHYNSNLTILPDGIFASLGHFRDVVIGASCDGTGDLFESIRAGAKWPVFVENLRRAKSHVRLWLDVTVQRDNVGALGDLLSFAQAEGVPLRLQNILQDPPDLSVRSLPAETKARHRASVEELRRGCAQAGMDELARELQRINDYMLG